MIKFFKIIPSSPDLTIFNVEDSIEWMTSLYDGPLSLKTVKWDWGSADLISV